MHRLKSASALFALFCALTAVWPAGTALAGPRADHWSGFDFGAGGTPFPSVIGTMIGLNVGDAARLSFGYGNFIHWDNYQLDAKVFFAQTPWAMFVGTGLSYLNGSEGQVLIWKIPFDRGFIPYVETGMDFQSETGVHVTFNAGLAVPGGTLIVLPGIALGWYF